LLAKDHKEKLDQELSHGLGEKIKPAVGFIL
jgi:hypothetical protein